MSAAFRTLGTLIAMAGGVVAQQGEGVFDLSLDELQQLKVSVASIRDRPMREQPAVVTVITAEQIARMGARDLVDVLKTVPGFWIQADILGGVLTPTFRGMAGGEGKILLLIDGVEQNDNLFGAPVIGQRFAAATIRRIEILRGPGSARYGGNAELAVIKVFTKGAEVDGVQAQVQTSASETTMTNGLVSFAGGKQIDDWTFTYAGHLNRGTKATGTYTTPTGTAIDLGDTSDLAAGSLNVSAGWRGLQARLLYDDYEYDDQLFLGGGDTQVNRRTFTKLQAELRYEWQVADDVTITPRLGYTRERPWGYERLGFKQNYLVGRHQADVEARLQGDTGGDLLLGTGFYRVESELESSPPGFGFDPATHYGDEQVHHDDWWLYGQYDFDAGFALVSLGLRYEDHSTVGDALVPRLCLSRAFEHWHAKLMYSQAYRVPQIETINSAVRTGGMVEPELLDAVELEIGHSAAGTAATANLFWMQNRDAIYFDTTVNGNRNGGDIETAGGEFAVSHELDHWRGSLSYSFYQTLDNEVPPTQVPRDDNANLGVPEHKLVLGLGWMPAPETTVTLTATILGQRWAWMYDGVGTSTQRLDAETDLSLFLLHRTGSLTFGLGVSNLLDEDEYYAQPYFGGLTPVPAQGRALLMSMGARF